MELLQYDHAYKLLPWLWIYTTENERQEPFYITQLKRQIIWTIHLHDFGFHVKISGAYVAFLLDSHRTPPEKKKVHSTSDHMTILDSHAFINICFSEHVTVKSIFFSNVLNTPPKINIEPENDGLEDDFPLPGVYSQVPC